MPVRDDHGGNLPSRILRGMGNQEFITMSTTGDHMCAVTEEEDEYWIIYHNFTSNHTTSG